MDNETKKMFEMLINKIDNISESQNNMGERLNSMEIRQDEIFSVVKAIKLKKGTLLCKSQQSTFFKNID